MAVWPVAGRSEELQDAEAVLVHPVVEEGVVLPEEA